MRTIVTMAAVAAASLMAAPASAENWRASSSTDAAAAFIDTDSIRRDGGRVRFWREVRWPQVQTMGDGLRYDRIAAHYEADCRAMTLRAFSLRVRLGEQVVLSGDDDGELEHARPGTTAETDLRSACFGEWPQG